MKMLFSFLLVFAITFGATFAFMDPEILSFGDSDTATITKAQWNELQRETAEKRRKKAQRQTSVERRHEDNFDDFMNSFGAPTEKMSKRVLPAPSLDVSGWKNARPLNIASLRGKIIVLNFWTTWCGHCIDAIPHNKELVQEYGNKGVVLIGVCTSKGNELMPKIAQENNILYPIAQDNNRNTGKAYKVNAYPRYCVIDANGNLRFEDLKKREVEPAIKFLLKN